jgi:hypothetical protein
MPEKPKPGTPQANFIDPKGSAARAYNVIVLPPVPGAPNSRPNVRQIEQNQPKPKTKTKAELKAEYEEAVRRVASMTSTYKEAKKAALGNYVDGEYQGYAQPIKRISNTGTLLTFTVDGHIQPNGWFFQRTEYSEDDPFWVWETGTVFDGAYTVDGQTPYTAVRTTTPAGKPTGTSIAAGYAGMDLVSQRAFLAWQALLLAIDAMNKKKKAYEGATDPVTPPANIVPDTTTIDPPNPTAPVTYNVPSIKSSYHRSDAYYQDNMLYAPGGSPAPSTALTDAKNLWLSAGAHKGMIQTYQFWSSNTSKDTNLPDWYKTANLNKKRYGFQFLYNPSSITMTWAGTPVVDPGFIMSGKDTTPYVVPGQSQSTISFGLVLNRRYDLGLIETYGVEEVARRSMDFYGQEVSVEELKQIRDRGIMYDVEYLLKTLVGFEMFSKLRGYQTADVGFLLGYTIEVHLGKNLRYLGTIAGFEVTHKFFTKDMIPMVGDIGITINRRIEPAFAGDSTSNAATKRTDTSSRANQLRVLE